jgi:hypothetical protein
MRYRWAGRHAGGSSLANTLIQLGDDLADFLRGRLRLVLGGHFAGIDFLNYLRPYLSVQARFEITRQLIQSQVALFLFGTVTTYAMLGEKTLKGLGAVGERTKDKQQTD